jgi:N-methylhydantoinase A
MKTDIRLAVDIGGTFTDIALERPGRALVTVKTLTTPGAPELGVMHGIKEALARAGAPPSEVAVIIHGTTLATNALIEKRGAKTAMLTTEGHRDSLEMAYENRFEQYDVNIDRPPPLVPRWLRLPVRERMNAEGAPLIPIDDQSVAEALAALDSEEVESVAIAFLHSYANPAHERRAAEIIALARPDLSLSLSSEVAPEIREYERQTTTVANAYVRPLMERYLRALEAEFESAGFGCPFLLVTSGGGLCTVETAARFPIRLVESGPAGGAVLAASLARRIELPEVLSFDMGGTTAKMCLIDKFTPGSARAFEVDRSYRFKKGSGMPVRIPVIELVEIGAGGGSIASVDALKRLQVGPESAGAEPGPACYGRGGPHATVTDADFVAGKIVADRFADGSIGLDSAAAETALTRDVGATLGLDCESAAFAVLEMVDENMAGAARAHAVEQGKDIRRRTMIAFGGAAPLHAARLAEKLDLSAVIVPDGAGVGSAIGFLLAPASYEIVRSLPTPLDSLEPGRIAQLFASLRDEAERVVRAAAPEAALTESHTAFMRYAGQGYEIPVPLDGAKIEADALRRAFEENYRAIYGRIIPQVPIEILSWSLRMSAAALEAPAIAIRPTGRIASPIARHPAYDADAGRRIPYAVHERAALAAGDRVKGPALIVEAQTTTVVTPQFDAIVDQARNLVLMRRSL